MVGHGCQCTDPDYVQAWLARQLTQRQRVSPEDALPGRDTPVLFPIPRHTVLGLALDEVPDSTEVAYFALGCYWSVERLYWRLPGVRNTAVGFMGGHTPNPTYRESCTGRTGHTETVRVVFDPTEISYEELLCQFWEAHDPTQVNRQGNDIGTQYRSAIFPVNEDQHAAAERTRQRYQEQLTAAGYGQIATEITPGQTFYFAEAEHQQYLDKNPNGYACDHRTGVACVL